MATISSIFAQEILDSRAYPTIQTTVVLSTGQKVSSAVPSGASKGALEAVELRDGDTARFGGKGVLKAVDIVNSVITQNLKGADPLQQQAIDQQLIKLDGTKNKSKLGANTILSVSQAVAKAGALVSTKPLYEYIASLIPNHTFTKKIPIPLYNLIGGGSHAQNSTEMQEFIVIPASSKSFQEGLSMVGNIYHALFSILSEQKKSTLVTDEGGFSYDSSNRDALLVLKSACERAGYKYGFDVFMGIDVAANSLKTKEGYSLRDVGRAVSADELLEFYKKIISEFTLLYMEDAFAEDDIEGWKKMYASLSDKTLVVGDDLTVTNPLQLQMALENKLINGIIIKLNQIGTVSETLAVCEIARFKNLKLAVAHRSGETMDTFAADFAVGVGADYIKFGAPARERIAKYNRVLEIIGEIKVSGGASTTDDVKPL